MDKFTRAFILLAVASALIVPIAGQKRDRIEIVKPRNYTAPSFARSQQLQDIVTKAAVEVIRDKDLKPSELAFTVIDLTDGERITIADVQGELRLYPASVVKMFYMAALHRQLEDGKIVLTKEMERGLSDMIVDSSNEATQYILDVLTDTSSGAEMPQKEFVKWQYKRDRVNRFFSSLGYTNINVNQKTFCEDAYGIEQQTRAYKGQNRNMLTTNATARLMAEIALRRFVSEQRSDQMLALMSRDWQKRSSDTDNQAVGFTGRALIENDRKGAKLWSKAGWTSRSRHDVAFVDTGKVKLVLAIFTENHANDRDIIPAIAERVIKDVENLRR